MNAYYPDRIADDSDDDVLTSCSALETEGASNSSAVLQTTAAEDKAIDNGHNSNKSHPWRKVTHTDDDHHASLEELCEHDDELELSRHGSSKNTPQPSPRRSGRIDDKKDAEMAHMIQHERERRLGVDRNDRVVDHGLDRSVSEEKSNENYNASSNNLLGNIRGWFGGGGNNQQGDQNAREQSVPLKNPIQNAKYAHRSSDGFIDESDDDSSSAASSDDFTSSDEDESSSESENEYGDEDLKPQERARIHALRYLSNSCVDAGRKAKTASYVRGLERLDLKRKRDRFEKELDIVETEMNKDRGLLTDVEADFVLATAAKLVLELPCTFDESSQVTTYDEYMTMSPDPQAISSLWENKEATDGYYASLQTRLKEALERTRSLEKRLTILEQAGDEIIMSLCEDLVEVTGDSNKAEARYVKKGKELQRKRGREQMRYRKKIKKAERHVRHLEERLLNANEQVTHADQSVSSSDSSESSDDEEQENDEVRLEAKLSSIKAKNVENKADHKAEVESVRRQCEQLRLRMSVARLVMEGDENLREYVAILVRAQSKLLGRVVEDIPPPPHRIIRARAKLLKVIHHENIYEQRLSISKAFSDATINALEQELIERETSGQQMEVRCLNDLVAIERETMAFAVDANKRIKELESEARDLEETVAACTGSAMEDLNLGQSAPGTKSAQSTDNYSSSESDDEADESESAPIKRRLPNLQNSNESVGGDSRSTTSEVESDEDIQSLPLEEQEKRSSATVPPHDKNCSNDADKEASKDIPEECTTVPSPSSGNKMEHDSDGQDEIPEREDGGDKTPGDEIFSGLDYIDGGLVDDEQPLSDDVTSTNQDNVLDDETDTLEVLGQKLRDTLSQYQKGADLTSAEKVKHLTNMNLIVLQIAKTKGIQIDSSPGVVKLRSWRRKNSKSDRKRPERERRSAKAKSRRRREKDKERVQEKERLQKKERRKSERSVSLVW